VVTRALLLIAAACSSKARPDGVGSAGVAGSGGSAGSGSAGAAGSASSGSPADSAGSARSTPPMTPALGEVQIRVEWADVPAAARASPGRTPCNTPRAPSVSPTTTWGVPDAVVIVDGARADPPEPRIVLAECALSPRVAIGSSLVVESAADRPASVALAKRAELPKPERPAPGAAAPRLLRLPIAGHAVAVSLDAGGVYELATADKDPELAWIVAPRPGAVAAVTDTTGQIVLRNISPGTHAVTAWLPPRAGQPARIARGIVTVAAGALAELSLPLAPVP
jgi:hypothetical protein